MFCPCGNCGEAGEDIIEQSPAIVQLKCLLKAKRQDLAQLVTSREHGRKDRISTLKKEYQTLKAQLEAAEAAEAFTCQPCSISRAFVLPPTYL